MSERPAPQLFLKRNEDRRLRAGHVWIYSNEIDTARSPLRTFQAGDIVNVFNHTGKSLGSAFINPHSLICARLFSERPDTELSTEFFVHRIRHALTLRQNLFALPYYRLVFAESDLLPGVIIDRFDTTLVVQINTAAMDIRQEQLLSALQSVCPADTIVLKNTSSTRALEGLASHTEIVKGSSADTLRVIENDVHFDSPLLEGQKTGWFYDHRRNRLRLTHYVAGKNVLDVFSYVGAWGVQAAVAGARAVLCVDSSKTALQYVATNARLNQVSDKVSAMCGDAVAVLKQLKQQGQVFDCINLDPPAFIKRKKDHHNGLSAYQQINRLAMELLTDDAILVSSSCSFHLSRDDLRKILLQCARKLGRHIQILEQGQQGPDHPIHPAISETAYLKTFICRICDMPRQT